MTTKNINISKKQISDQTTNKLMMRELLNSDKYFEWLDDFSKDYIAVCASQACFLSTNNQDRAKIVFLRVLFNMIDKYANDNNIIQHNLKGGSYYLFCSNDVKYQIGCYHLGNEVDYFCRRINDKALGNFIDINDIRRDSGLEQNKTFDLKQLEKSIQQLLEIGFNKDEIMWVVEKTISDVKVKKLGKNR